MFDAQLWAFVGISCLLTITPGADTLLVLRNSVAHGREVGFRTIGGIVSGLFVHAALSALGLSLILTQSVRAYSVLKWAGAAYLIWLGLQSLLSALRAEAPSPNPFPVNGEGGSEAPPNPPAEARGNRAGFLQGFLNNLLNPKVVVFYLAFLPQFIGADDPVLGKSLLMAGIHAVEGVLWLGIVAVGAGAARVWLAKDSLRRAASGISGLALVGFGVKLAADDGPLSP